MLFVVCTLLLFGLSLFTAAPADEKVRGLTWRRKEESPRTERREEELPEPGLAPRRRRINAGLSILVLVLLAGLWVYFA
jgi:hypothetical protein